MDWLFQTLGSLLVLAALLDVFLTVIYARSGTGLLSPYINRAVWWFFRTMGKHSQKHRDSILSFGGPTLLVIIATCWGLLSVIGFTLILWPAMGDAIQASQGPTPTDFAATFYYAGYSFTTLGTGDLLPKTGFFRFLMVFKAALGFSFFTLIITYFLSIYESLRRRNTYAQTLHHKTRETGDAGEFVVLMAAAGDPDDLKTELSEIADFLSDLIEMHRFYPILHYFRFKEIQYALPRMMMISMDTVSLITTAFDIREYRKAVRSVAAEQVWSAGTHLLERLSSAFLPKRFGPDRYEPSAEEERLWRKHFLNTVKRLLDEGVDIAPDLKGAEERYVSLRRIWNPYILAFSDSMLYY